MVVSAMGLADGRPGKLVAEIPFEEPLVWTGNVMVELVLSRQFTDYSDSTARVEFLLPLV